MKKKSTVDVPSLVLANVLSNAYPVSLLMIIYVKIKVIKL